MREICQMYLNTVKKSINLLTPRFVSREIDGRYYVDISSFLGAAAFICTDTFYLAMERHGKARDRWAGTIN